MLNENVVKLLGSGMWDLATCGDGEPNVVPVAFKDVTPDGKLVVGDVFLDTTLKNLSANGGKIAHAEVVDTNGSGHGALAGFLMQHGVDALICGGIGGGAQAALAEAGIKLYGGVSGDADAAVNALLSGNLGYNPNVHCDHHDHEHGTGGHTCGDHGCGKHSCH